MKVLKDIWECILGIGMFAFVAAWCVTIACVTFGAAIWSFEWLMGMI